MFFSKDILARTSEGVETIIVTGTNGKSTTCHMLEQALRDAGRDPLANRSGANLLSGITAEFTGNASWNGRARTDCAVIECDEAALRHVVPLVRPRVIVVTNLFRDQLDRYGEVMHTLEVIREGILEVPDCKLVLNADDSLTASLGRDVPNPVYYYGFDVPFGAQEEPETQDARRCLLCGTEYVYDYHTYAHLGGFRCPSCGYHRPAADVAVTAILEREPDRSLVEMRLGEERRAVTVGLPAVYNIYNAAAAVCAFRASGHPADRILKTLETVTPGFGRMETFDLDGVPVRMILIKNPAGCDRALGYLGALGRPYDLVLCLNDRTADGHDISWIWDADYEKLASDPGLGEICISGDRAADLRLRLKYAGVPLEKIHMAEDSGEVLVWMKGCRTRVCALPNYTAMLELREMLRQATGGRQFWEG